jgi:hypothetical protein
MPTNTKQSGKKEKKTIVLGMVRAMKERNAQKIAGIQ